MCLRLGIQDTYRSRQFLWTGPAQVLLNRHFRRKVRKKIFYLRCCYPVLMTPDIFSWCLTIQACDKDASGTIEFVIRLWLQKKKTNASILFTLQQSERSLSYDGVASHHQLTPQSLQTRTYCFTQKLRKKALPFRSNTVEELRGGEAVGKLCDDKFGSNWSVSVQTFFWHTPVTKHPASLLVVQHLK